MTEIAFAPVVGLAAIAAAIIGVRLRKTARAYLMFAAALYASLAFGNAVAMVAGVPQMADAIVFLVAALAPACLVLALAGNAVSTMWAALILSLCLACGIFAGMSGVALAAFAPLLVSVCALLAFGLRGKQLYTIAASLSFVMAAGSFMSGERNGFALFSAAGLLGMAVALASGHKIAGQRKMARATAIGRPR